MRISPDHPLDRRSIEGRVLPEADSEAEAAVARLREAELALARLAVQVQRSGHCILSGAGSIRDWLMQRGLSRLESLRVLRLGHTFAAAPEAEALVGSGALGVERAAAIGRVLSDPSLLRPGDDWVQTALEHPLRELWKLIRARVDECAQEDLDLVEVSLFVREEDREDFRRARVLASRKAKKALTGSQTFVQVVGFYLDKNDPDRKVPRARRVGDTAGIPGSRYVPAEVVRAVRARSGDGCEFYGCTNKIFIEKAHRQRHADGGAREADDLFDLCNPHHTLQESGRLVHVGTAPSGKPVFRFNDRVYVPGGPLKGIPVDEWEARGRPTELSVERREARRNGRNGASEGREGPGGASFVGERFTALQIRSRAPPG